MSETWNPADFGLAPLQEDAGTWHPAEFGLGTPLQASAQPQKPAASGWADYPGQLASGAAAGLKSVIDAPAEFLARQADRLGITGGVLPSGEQTRAADIASRQAWEADPNRSIVGYMAGQAAPFIAAAGPITAGMKAFGPVGEFLAGAGGRGLATRVASGAVGGAIQGAGAAAVPTTDTENMSLLDRIKQGAATGAAVGGVIPAAFAAGRGTRNYLTGSSALTPERAALAQQAVGMGIPLTATDIQPGAPMTKWVSSVLDYLPFSGASGRREALQNAINTNVAKTFGGDAAGAFPTKITQDTMAGARQRIGAAYDSALRGASVPYDLLEPQLAAIESRIGASAMTPQQQNAVRNVMGRIQDVAAENNGHIPGSLYQEFRKRGSALDELMGPTDPTRNYARDIRQSMDAAFGIAHPDRAAQFAQANQQWRAMRAIDPEVVRGMPGDISPLRLQNAANRAYPDRAWNEPPTDLGTLGDVAQTFLRRLPESGTAPRLMAGKFMEHFAAPFLGAGAGVGHMTGAMPLGAIGEPLGILAGAAGAGRGINAAINSNWLRNAMLKSAQNPQAPTALELSLAPYALYGAPLGALPGYRPQLPAPR